MSNEKFEKNIGENIKRLELNKTVLKKSLLFSAQLCTEMEEEILISWCSPQIFCNVEKIGFGEKTFWKKCLKVNKLLKLCNFVNIFEL